MKKISDFLLPIIVLFFACNPNYKTELGDGYYLDTYEGKDYSFICDSNRAGMIDI